MKWITMSGLGSSGGVGSQFTSYAALRSIANATGRGLAFSFDMIDANDKIGTYGGIKIVKMLQCKYDVFPNEFFKDFVTKHINFHIPYDKTVYELDPNLNYDFSGRFDLYTYWYNSVGQEIANLQFQEGPKDRATRRIDEIRRSNPNKQLVSIHIRRGDYLLPHHSFCELGDEYYSKAVSNFIPSNNFVYLIFSNDSGYAKDLFEGSNVIFIDAEEENWLSTKSEFEDLCMQSLCDHNIIANSSYSWAAAYLNKNPLKKVICPTNYLNPDHESAWINGNYYPPTWINIDN